MPRGVTHIRRSAHSGMSGSTTSGAASARSCGPATLPGDVLGHMAFGKACMVCGVLRKREQVSSRNQAKTMKHASLANSGQVCVCACARARVCRAVPCRARRARGARGATP